MDSGLALLAALAATGFALDLWFDYRRRPRPHIAGYGTGITLFAVAAWAFYLGLTFGWSGFLYRPFYLFGAVLNIPFLALGSMFLVVGRRSGHVMTLLLGAFTAISTTLVTTVPFTNPLPSSGVPADIFSGAPRVFAIIGGASGGTLLIALALFSLFRFWRKNRRIVWGNLLIVAGTLAASSGGTGLALGESAAFAVSLFLAASLIWAGYRVASGARRPAPSPDPARSGDSTSPG